MKASDLLGLRFTTNFRLVGVTPATGEARIAFLDADGVEHAGNGGRITVDLTAFEHALSESVINVHGDAGECSVCS